MISLEGIKAKATFKANLWLHQGSSQGAYCSWDIQTELLACDSQLGQHHARRCVHLCSSFCSSHNLTKTISCSEVQVPISHVQLKFPGLTACPAAGWGKRSFPAQHLGDHLWTWGLVLAPHCNQGVDKKERLQQRAGKMAGGLKHGMCKKELGDHGLFSLGKAKLGYMGCMGKFLSLVSWAIVEKTESNPFRKCNYV